MNIISLKDSNLTTLTNLLNLIKEKNIITKSLSIDYDVLKTLAKNYALNLKSTEEISTIYELKDFSYYDIEQYNVENKADTNLVFSYMMALSSMVKEVNKNIELNNGTRKEFNSSKYEPLDLSVSPPMEVYEYVGNNKLSINPSGRSYGLLFE